MPSSIRMIVTPARSSPAAIVAAIGVAPAMARQQRWVDVEDPVRRQVEQWPRNDLAVVREHPEVRLESR